MTALATGQQNSDSRCTTSTLTITNIAIKFMNELMCSMSVVLKNKSHLKTEIQKKISTP